MEEEFRDLTPAERAERRAERWAAMTPVELHAELATFKGLLELAIEDAEDLRVRGGKNPGSPLYQDYRLACDHRRGLQRIKDALELAIKQANLQAERRRSEEGRQRREKLARIRAKESAVFGQAFVDTARERLPADQFAALVDAALTRMRAAHESLLGAETIS